MKYVAPVRNGKAFTCPHCGVLAQQRSFSNPVNFSTGGDHSSSDAVASTICLNCGHYCLWHGEAMIFPNRGTVPPPSGDMPADVRETYEEAATIAGLSPRAAAALIRLGIQRLCIHLGGKGTNINEDIGLLVANGLPSKVQKALDVVRVVGNKAVHPGVIAVDDPDVVAQLFRLLNLIVESMITVPNEIDKAYEALPSTALGAIEKRDSRPK